MCQHTVLHTWSFFLDPPGVPIIERRLIGSSLCLRVNCYQVPSRPPSPPSSRPLEALLELNLNAILSHPIRVARTRPRAALDISRQSKTLPRGGLAGRLAAQVDTQMLFMHLACLPPVMTFSGIAASITGGSMGVFDFLVAGGRGGVAYSVFSGRTMIFIGPIGLTLAFTTALYAFCRQWHPRFMPLHSRTGVRTALWLMLLAVADAPELMSCCTQLTDYACTFVHEAAVFCWGMSCVGASAPTCSQDDCLSRIGGVSSRRTLGQPSYPEALLPHSHSSGAEGF